jgi:glycosyltransferase involved in cell wall biosynthesis
MTSHSSLQNLSLPPWLSVFPLQHLHRRSFGLFQNILALKEMKDVLAEYHPNVLHSVGVKFIPFSTLLNVPKALYDLGGLGYIFTSSEGSLKDRIKRSVLKNVIFNPFFARAFKNPKNQVLIQNPDDLQDLKKLFFWKKHWEQRIHIIPGSGVDLSVFNVHPLPPKTPFVVSCVSRLLKDKGITELVQAARLLKDLPLEIRLYGAVDPNNPSSLTEQEVQQWHQQKDIIFKGFATDMNQVYQETHIAVLPSYREGLPRSLLEAASCGRPIITTNVPGCRQTVVPEITGWLIPAKDPEALAEQIRKCFLTAPELLTNIGQKGRLFAQNYFSDTAIHHKILGLYSSSFTLLILQTFF